MNAFREARHWGLVTRCGLWISTTHQKWSRHRNVQCGLARTHVTATTVTHSMRNVPPSSSSARNTFHKTTTGTTASLSTRTNNTTSNNNNHPSHPYDVRIVEVGPRDGLQNEPGGIVSTEHKVELIQSLIQAGCGHIEVGSFVSHKAVPNMANTPPVVQALAEWWSRSGRSHQKEDGSDDVDDTNHENTPPVRFSALVPTLRYLQDALLYRDTIDEIAIFASASETFSQKNLNCSIAESMIRFQEILNVTKDLSWPVRGYLSCAMGCPYEGIAAPTQQVGRITEQLLELGCYEVALSDTIGVGTPQSTRTMIDDALIASGGQANVLAVHFHDTFGQALSNIMVSLDRGITTIDSSVAGLGGCPYAKGATGNVATEDVVYMLNGMNVTTGIDIEKLVDASEFICGVLNRPIVSRAGSAIAAKRRER